MKIKNILFLFLLIFSGCSTHNEISFLNDWDTLRVLQNPYKGWYHHLLDNGITKYSIKNDSIFESFPGMDHLYLRLCWSYLEPQEGRFDWHYIDDVVDKYVPKGYKISFRISCSETGAYPGSVGQESDGIQYATPRWVRQAGAKGSVVRTRSGETITWVPDWADPVYLQKLNNFHKAFAERYDDKSWVSYVDIGSIGDWGEGHTSFTTQIPPTIEEIKANVNIYIQNYKKSQLVCNDDLLTHTDEKNTGDLTKLYAWVVSNGITFRDDSPLVLWYLQQYLKTWTISHPHFFDPLYLKMPVVFELQHYGSVKKNGSWLGKNGADTIEEYGYSGAEIMRKAIETMHATYIGYHGYAEEWLADNPDLTKELANLCGYWYFPVKASYPDVMRKGGNEISIVWLNKGVAPSYNDFNLILRFESEEDPKHSFDITINSGNKSWLPGLSKTELYKTEIPLTSKSGSYVLKFRLTEKAEEKNRTILIGIKESKTDEGGFVKIGKLIVK